MSNTLSPDQAWAELKKLGAAQAVIQFSGGNDEGGTDSIELIDSSGQVIRRLKETSDWEWQGGQMRPAVRSSEELAEGALAQALAEPVYAKYSTFAGEFYVNGTVTWEVATKKVKMTGNESHETWDEFDEEF